MPELGVFISTRGQRVGGRLGCVEAGAGPASVVACVQVEMCLEVVLAGGDSFLAWELDGAARLAGAGVEGGLVEQGAHRLRWCSLLCLSFRLR